MITNPIVSENLVINNNQNPDREYLKGTALGMSWQTEVWNPAGSQLPRFFRSSLQPPSVSVHVCGSSVFTGWLVPPGNEPPTRMSSQTRASDRISTPHRWPTGRDLNQELVVERGHNLTSPFRHLFSVWECQYDFWLHLNVCMHVDLKNYFAHSTL